MELAKDAQALELDFDRFFKQIGFLRITEIAGRAPEFPNADYFSEAGPMIVELKVVEKDYFEHGGVVNRLHGFVPVPVDVAPDGTGVYSVRLPVREDNLAADTFEPALRRLLKKADEQIEGSKVNLFDGEGCGFAIFALNGFRSAGPDLVKGLLCELLADGEYSNVAGFMVCSPLISYSQNGSEQRVKPCFVSIEAGLPEEWADAWLRTCQAYVVWAERCGHQDSPP